MDCPTRRRLLALTGTTLTAGCGSLPSVTDDTDETSTRSCETTAGLWPSSQHGPANRGYARSDSTPSPTDREFVREDIPDGTGPMIGESRVYVPSEDGILALGRSSEEIVWRYELENPAGATQALGCGRVYIQPFRQLLALDQRDGTVVWTFDRGYGVASPNLSVGPTGLVVPTNTRVFELTHDGEVSWQSEELSKVVQTVDEFFQHPESEMILDQCAVKVFHRLDGMDDQWAGEFGLNHAQKRFVQTALPGNDAAGYSQALLGVDGEWRGVELRALPGEQAVIDFDPRQEDHSTLPG